MTEAQRDRKYKIWLFLSVYALFALVKVCAEISFFRAISIEMIGHVMTGILWLTTVIITKATTRRKIFKSKTVIFFFTGIYLWLIWGTFTNFTHITLVSDAMAYGKILALLFFTHALFLSARIIEIYNLRCQFMKINIFCFGLVIFFAYIAYFNGFSFLYSLSSIFGSGQRYRFSYGFTHANGSGNFCFQFMAFSAIYHAVLEEEKPMHKNRTRIHYYFMYFIAVTILLTSASRAAILRLILFWLAYLLFKHFKRLKPVFIAFCTSVIAAIVFIFGVNNLYFWRMFMAARGFYYGNAFSFLASQDILLAGLGLTRHRGVTSISGVRLMDSFYLTTFMQTGLVGFIIFFGAVFVFTFIYFKDIVHMTKLQKLSGALFVSMLCYGLLETQFYIGGAIDFTNWVLIILCMNDKAIATKSLRPHNHISPHNSNLRKAR